MEQLNPETVADFLWAQFYIAVLILEACSSPLIFFFTVFNISYSVKYFIFYYFQKIQVNCVEEDSLGYQYLRKCTKLSYTCYFLRNLTCGTHCRNSLHNVLQALLSISFSGTKYLSLLPFSMLPVTICVVCNWSSSKNWCFTLKVLLSMLNFV